MSSESPTVFDKLLPAGPLRDRLATISWLYLAGWTCFYLFYSVAASWRYQSLLTNGSLQLLNPLRRMAAGQVLGVEFKFFHGIGIPFLHYPIFALLGKDPFASEVSRHIITLVAFLIVALALGRVVTSSWKLTGLFVLAHFSLWEIFSISYRFVPSNSLNSLRSAIPFLLISLVASRVSPKLKAFTIPLLLALCVWISFEQGIATWVAYLIASVFILVHRNDFKSIALLAGQFTVALVLCAGLTILCCGFEGARNMTQYYFRTIPADQFWYFGGPPNQPLHGLLDLLSWPRFTFLLIVALLAIAWIIRNRLHNRFMSLLSDEQWIAVLTLLLYGAFSTAIFLCYASKGNMAILGFSVLVAVLAGCFVLPIRTLNIGRWDLLKSQAFSSIACLILLVGFFLTNVTLLWAISDTFRAYSDHVRSEGGTFIPLDETNGEYLRSAIAVIDSRVNKVRSGDIWSTYSGLLEAHYSIFNTSHDYIIHALGPKSRKDYLDDFRNSQPRFVQTLNPTYSKYEEWIQNTSWPFYEELVSHYHLIATTRPFLIWEKSPISVAVSSGWIILPVEGDHITIDAAPGGPRPGEMIVLKINYRTTNKFSWLPILAKTPRYLVVPENTQQVLGVSLAPDDTEREFPLVPLNGQPIRIHFEIRSLLPGAHLQVTGASYHTIQIEAATLKPLTARFVGD